MTTRGNRAWQLQVRLASNPSTFYVNYVQTTAPSSAQSVNSGMQTRLGTTHMVDHRDRQCGDGRHADRRADQR